MAHCELTTEEQVVLTKVNTGVTLTLSNEEAQFLRDILGQGVVGSGRRVLNDNIHKALKGVGYTQSESNDFNGMITFFDPKDAE